MKTNFCKYTSNYKETVSRLGNDILRHFPEGYTLEILGPFGLGASWNIWIKCKNNKDLDRDKQLSEPYLHAFQIEPNGDTDKFTFFRIDSTVNTEEYPKNSIGAWNGLNFPRIPIPNSTTTKEFILLYYPNFKFEKE